MFKKLLVFVFVLALVLPVNLFAGDPVVGCPLGVESGKVWLHSTTYYISANKAYWNDSPTDTPEMVAMPAGWHAKILKSSYRTQFGITSRLSGGFLLTYWDKDIAKEVWKQKNDGSWFKKTKSFHSFGFGDIWVYGVYKIIEKPPRFEAISLGVGYKFDSADNTLVVHGIGSGAKSMRIAFLTHIDLIGKIGECSSIWYEHRGKVRYIEVKNEQGESVEWEKSGWDLGEKYGYNIGIEYELSDRFKIVPKFMGWWKTEDRNKDGETVENTRFYEHSIGIVVQYFPIGTEHEHCKIIAGIKAPVLVVNSFSATFVPQFMAMWTF